MANISIDSLADAVMQELEEYTDEVDENMQAKIDEKTDEILNDLKNDPIIPRSKNKGNHYKDKFYKKQIAKGKGYKRNRIANRKHQLTHLLEYPHATRSGGQSKAFPHWRKAQEKADRLHDEMLEVIKK